MDDDGRVYYFYSKVFPFSLLSYSTLLIPPDRSSFSHADDYD